MAIDYNPVDFTHELVAPAGGAMPHPKWADGAEVSMIDFKKRSTFEGPIDFDQDGEPLNPRGRTGMKGRGLLGRWGPNHAADLLLTRDHPVTRKLQIVIIKRRDATDAIEAEKEEDRKAQPRG